MKRTPQHHARGPRIGAGGRVFVALLALPFAIGAVLAVRRGDLWDTLLFGGMCLVAGYAAWIGIHYWAAGQPLRTGGLPRETVPRKARGSREHS